MRAYTLNAGVCRSCGASIIWGRTPNGKAIPLDAEPVEDGNLAIRDDDAVVSDHGFPPSATRYVTHFATCPNAGQHRRRGSRTGKPASMPPDDGSSLMAAVVPMWFG